jgi:hypothetical protein
LRSRNRHWILSAFRLEPRDRARAVRALVWLMAAEMAVRVLPFSTLSRWMERVPPSRSRGAPLTSSDCAAAIRRAARVFPGGRCLARAVAASCLLRRAGRIATLSLGVGFDADRRFEAHAWLECDGVVVTGGEISNRYVPLGAPAQQDT